MIETEATPDAGGENVLDEFVDYFNASDFDELALLLDEDVTVPMLGATGREDVARGLGELSLRNFGLIFTRGELGEEPVIVAWLPVEGHVYRRMGYFVFSFTDDDGESLIEHIDYDDTPLQGQALLAEEPDPDDLAEGDEWHEWETGES